MEHNKRLSAALGMAIRAALDAGREIMRIYTDPAQDFGVERKADDSPLTLADKAAHQCIERHLAATGVPILSEEGRCVPHEERREWEAFWMVDPLDGTKEFIKKNGEFTVNIALVVNTRPHLGVVYAPALKELYFGEPLLGAFKTTGITEWTGGMTLPRLVEMSHRLPLAGADRAAYTVVSSRTHSSPETEKFIEEVRKEHPDMRTVSIGSSLKLCLVAEGAADVYPRFAPTMEWDTCAGHAIARCAGKQVYQAGADRPLAYNKEDLHNPWFIVR